MGLLSEILMRTYFESQGKTSYVVRERLNFDEEDKAAIDRLTPRARK
jgi:hypothetical protein